MYALIHSFRGLELSYLLMYVPMLVAMIRERAPFKRFVESPLLAAILLLLTGILFAIVSALLSWVGLTDGTWFKVILFVPILIALGNRAGQSLARYVDEPEITYRRGAIVSAMQSLRGRQRRRPGSTLRITLAGLPIEPSDEVMHFKCIGTTGTGKSTAIREMLSAALARGDRAIVADPDGGYLSHFYNAERGDVILNPFDPDSVKWNLLGEIRNAYDVDQLARSLIPESAGSDRSWTGYARTFFTAVVQQAIAAGFKDDREIYRLITMAPLAELKVMLAGTMAGPFLEDGNEKMFGSLRSVTASAVAALRYTTEQRAVPFSVRQWVRQGTSASQGGRGGVLFLPYKAGEIAALRSVISAWMRIAIFEAMDRAEGDQRLWFVVDELDALGEIDGLKDALARLRKFGGRCVLGFQSISQVSSTYGKGVADTIVENCGNSLILRCSASEHGGTSEFASRLIGHREVVHTMRSKTRTRKELWGSTTESQQRSIEPAVMSSEIERLPNLTGYLKFASIPDWHQVALAHVEYPIVRQRRIETQAPPIQPMDMAAVVPSAAAVPLDVTSSPPAAASRAAVRKGGRKPKASGAL